jgi:adenylate cyclase
VSSQSQRQLAAIMFTDMVGYTALMQKNETMARQQRDKNMQVFENCLRKYQGKLLQYYGDGTLSIFNSAVNAVQSAVEMQTLCRQEKVDMRIGIHSGDVMFDDTGVYGNSVNVASRIESLAVPGSIFISEKLFSEISNQGIDAKLLGYFELKNVQQPMQVYAISNPGIVVPSRDDVKGKVKQTLNSIAVLPFASLSSDPENEFFCDGITEELLNVLAKIEGLQVTSRTSSFTFKGKTEDIREIAAKLNVQKVLEGSVRKAGNKVRITAQLINAADGYHIWSETYDRSIEDIFAVQDDISREIANKFRLNLSEEEHKKEIVKAPTENLEAYRKYLQGIYLMNTQLPENVEPSINCLEEAAAMDPAFVAPHCYLCFQYYFMGYSGMMPLKQAYALSSASQKRAMEIDPQNDQALLASSIINIAYEFNWPAGKKFLEQSLEKNPNNLFALMVLCWYHAIFLEYDKAIEVAEKMLQLDPVGSFAGGSVAEMYLTFGNFDQAIKVANETLKFNPENPYPQGIRELANGFSGNWEPMSLFLEKMKQMYEEVPLGLGILGVFYCRTGEKEKARVVLEKLLEIEKQMDTILDQVALVYANLLDFENFEKQFRKCIDNKSQGVIFWYKSPMLPEEINNYEGLRRIRRELQLPV